MGFQQWLIALLHQIFLPKHAHTMEWQMLKLLNRDRRKHGLPSLKMQFDLRRVARKHSKDMAKLDYFEHKNLWGQTHVDRYKENSISEVTSGENLAKIAGYNFPVHRAEVGLMNSPGHRANILNKDFNCVGIGVYRSERNVYFFTQNFAKRELIFTRTPPSFIRAGKALTLSFKPLDRSRRGVLRLQLGDSIEEERGFPIHEGTNTLKVLCRHPGVYEVHLYVGNGPQLKLSNLFTLHVKKGWFW